MSQIGESPLHSVFTSGQLPVLLYKIKYCLNQENYNYVHEFIMTEQNDSYRHYSTTIDMSLEFPTRNKSKIVTEAYHKFTTMC